MVITALDIQNVLENELEVLKRKLCIGYELKVRWTYSNNPKLSGEVKGETIYVYDKEEELAMETLKHEFIDYAVSKIIEPYKEVTNKLIAIINEDAYRRKEWLVEALSRVIS